MSVPGSGWGYDKDIAQSLADIAEHLGAIVNHFDAKEERLAAAQRMALEAAPDIPLLVAVGDIITQTLDNDNLHLMKKHTVLRELAIELKNKTNDLGKELNKGSDHGKVKEAGRRGEIRGDKA